MPKFSLHLILFLAIFHTAGVSFAGNPAVVQMFDEPPNKSFKELGVLVEKQPLDIEVTIVADYIGEILKTKAQRMGANAIIIRSTKLVPRVFEKGDANTMDPLDDPNALGLYLQIEATAIKLDQP